MSYREMGLPNIAQQFVSREHLAWAVDAVVAARRSFKPGQLNQELIHPRDRKALYARSLVSHFAAEAAFMASLVAALGSHKEILGNLLNEKSRWPGQTCVVTLEDAIQLGYDGLAHTEAFQQLWSDVSPYANRIDGLAAALRGARELSWKAGLRAPWAGPMILGAWLRHLVRQRILPAGLRPNSLSLWPSGPRTIYRSPAPIAIESEWGPEYATRGAARAEILKHADTRLDEIITTYEEEGYERVAVRNLQRDVEATYLRISEPEQWSWRALSARYPLLSISGVRRAVGRVMDLLEIEPPEKRPGRPLGMRPLPSN